MRHLRGVGFGRVGVRVGRRFLFYSTTCCCKLDPGVRDEAEQTRMWHERWPDRSGSEPFDVQVPAVLDAGPPSPILVYQLDVLSPAVVFDLRNGRKTTVRKTPFTKTGSRFQCIMTRDSAGTVCLIGAGKRLILPPTVD